MSGEDQDMPRVGVEVKTEHDDLEGATFVRVCPQCGRFVTVRTTLVFRGCQPHGPNADCRRCGPVQMPFEGYV